MSHPLNSLTNRIKNRFAKRDATPRRKRVSRKLQLENLENRRVMAASLAFTAPYELTITADSRGSRISVVDMDAYNSPKNTNDLFHITDTSPDGTRSYSFHKSAIRNFKFLGSDNNDIYHAPTGIGFNNLPVTHFVDARGGRDVITTGMFNDTIHGGAGDDDITAGGGNDLVRGGSGRDRIWGGAGNDTIHGDAGLDDLYGDGGNDVLHGGNDPDLLEGGDGNDRLYGDGGNDFLYGGAGEDGLYGGAGVDYLHGGTGADRFLLNTNETGNRTYEFHEGTTVTFLALADSVTDDTDEDIRIRFTNEGARTITWPDGYSPATTSYTAGTWSDNDIKTFDDAFGTIADTTGNNALLYKANGGEPIFFRLGNASNQYIAFNDSSGNTHYSNQSFTWQGLPNADWTRQVVFHEIGHNWDTPQEADRLMKIWGPAVVNAFRDLSKWTQVTPTNQTEFQRSRDGNWWYQSGTQFTRWYGETNPLEDYAESFARYFMDQAGRPFLDGTATGAPAKVDLIRSWATLVRGLGTAARPVGAGGTWGNPNAASGNNSGPNSAIAVPTADTLSAPHEVSDVCFAAPAKASPSEADSPKAPARSWDTPTPAQLHDIALTGPAGWNAADSSDDEDDLLSLLAQHQRVA